METLTDCNGCGLPTCQSRLVVDIAPLGSIDYEENFAATRLPPTSWFQRLSEGVCDDAVERVHRSKLWKVPQAKEGGPPATPFGSPKCIPGPDKRAFVVFQWEYPELQGRDGSDAYRVFVVDKRRVVGELPHDIEVGDTSDDLDTTTATEPRGRRDVDGDGEIDLIGWCTLGGYCTDDTATERNGFR